MQATVDGEETYVSREAVKATIVAQMNAAFADDGRDFNRKLGALYDATRERELDAELRDDPLPVGTAAADVARTLVIQEHVIQVRAIVPRAAGGCRIRRRREMPCVRRDL